MASSQAGNDDRLVGQTVRRACSVTACTGYPRFIKATAWVAGALALLEISMTEFASPDTEFLLRRAEQEAVFAIRTDHPNAVAAHFDMALRYGERARMALIEGVDPLRLTQQDYIPRRG